MLRQRLEHTMCYNICPHVIGVNTIWEQTDAPIESVFHWRNNIN